MTYRLTSEAEEDIVGIAEAGLRIFGAARAREYHDGLFDLFDLIAANPGMARERSEISPPVRIFPYKAHFVIYVVEPSGEVLIIRLRHGHEKWTDD